MRTTITIDDDDLEELLALLGTSNRTKAINTAIQEYIRNAKLERLSALRGRVTIASNDELEALDQAEYRGG